MKKFNETEASPVNTPGMGNVVPGEVGSGDDFGDEEEEEKVRRKRLKNLRTFEEFETAGINEGRTYEGRPITPSIYTTADIRKPITKRSQLKDGMNVMILDHGLNQWIAYMRYIGFEQFMHKFNSASQYEDMVFDYSTEELEDAIKNGEILMMK